MNLIWIIKYATSVKKSFKSKIKILVKLKIVVITGKYRGDAYSVC